MYHNQIHQVQQRINTIQQMVSQMRQQEQNAVQQLNRVQQLCQECVSNLQNVTYGQQSFSGLGTTPGMYGTQQYGIGQNQFGNEGGLSTTSGLFDPTTMNPSTYQGTQQTFGGAGMYTSNPMFSGSPQQQQYTGGQFGTQFGAQQQQYTQGSGSLMATNTPLSDIATMNPDTYYTSRQRLGQSTPSISQIGQQAGIGQGFGSALGSSAGMGSAGMSMGNAPFTNIATMNPDTYQSAQQQLGGSSSSLSQIGQQAGISGSVSKNINQ